MVDSSSTSDSQTSRALNDKAAFYFEDDGSGSEDSSDCSRQIVVGICAMSKKSNSKPMLEILERLVRFEHLKPLIFEESVILNEPIERWPLCDCFISFHSKGFPLDKAVKYAELRKPMVINDLYMQYKIQDRQVVHEILTRQEIDHPRYVVLDREHDDCELVEAEDLIEVNKMVFHKPFVEKPLFAEDHNVYIYFPSSAGGGSQRLFRKIGSRSSVYSPVSSVRKTGSYVYEEFMPTDGTDVKVYTVGPDYAHAEARKSPALDGKVERDQNGKEVRYPVILSAAEKLIARKVCLAFKQMVCGFDLLRANGRSYVCDVNGFSFVKTSMKYYDDCAKILGNMVLRQLAPQLHIPYSITYQPEDIPIVPTTYGTMMELRNVIAVIRHGDRTPKQKMKMEVRHKKFFDLFDKYGGFKTCQLKLKRPKQLQEVLDIARFLLSEIRTQSDPEIEEKKSKLDQLKSVLEMYGHFSGINRKVQLKYQPQGAPKKSSSDDDEGPREASLVLILKWGGELTPAGKIQAEELGKAFRYMYPGGQGDYGHTPGLGILRLHSTFRHDLKIYASDEGRVQMTAAAFAKGFLALEGELTPILVQMVKSANMNGLLDNDNESSKYQNIVKEKLQGLMNFEGQLGEEECDKLATTGSSSLTEAIKFIGNPYSTCETIYKLMNDLLDKMNELKDDPKYRDMLLYHSESWELLIRRWNKLTRDFSLKNSQYDISKIPDIYDCVKYDLQHNKQVLKDNGLIELHKLSKAMADIVIPQEYGITKEEKMLISQCICTPLLRKILVDLQRNVDEGSTRLDSRYSKGITTPHRHVRTRLYFTSESHIHSLLTIIRYGGLLSAEDEQWTRAMEFVNAVSELNYMTQIVIMMYEDPTKDPLSDERFHVELHFSPGAYTLGIGSDPAGQGYRTQIKDKNARRVPTSGSGCVGGSSSTTSVGGSAAGAHTTGSLTAGAFTAGQKCSPGGEARHKAFQHLSEARLMESVDEQVEQSDSETSASPVKEIPKKATNTADVAATVVAGEKAAGKTTKPAATDSVSRAASKKRGGSSSAENVAASGSESTDDASKATEGTVTPRLRHHSGDNILHNVHKQDEYIRVEKPHRNSFSGFFIPNVPESPDNFTMGGGKRMLISTKVISGSSSAPNLLDLDFLPSSQAGLEGWKVPSIRPLETLHNSLTLKQLENFLIHMTEGSFRTPVPTPPYPPSTPCSSMVSSTNAQIMAALSSTQAYSMSSSMCSSEMSPSGLSHPDDILQRLKQLIDNGNVKQPSTNGSDELSSSTTGTPLELAAVTSASAISTAATSSTVAEATTDVAEATTDVAEATTDVAEATTDAAAHGVEPATDEETSVETKDGQTSKVNEVCVDSTKSFDHHQSSVSDSSVTHSATSTLPTKASLADTTAPASAGAEDTNVSNGTSDAASDTG